ncbi:hypothetical protein O6H91_06G036700 [Diphasiastrum complanatum]|uniref:Uncharacterized protein n=1 Tax=Diphasiastrum complanatum TaxID=34168 RepID=A0ACC2DCL9_DIPCM|nr:hypothetical protein O6H91_06G036700 [Diphasiastrum complanatum]
MNRAARFAAASMCAETKALPLASQKQSLTHYTGLRASTFLAIPKTKVAAAVQQRASLQIRCAAEPKTLEAVQGIVATQLAVDPTIVQPSSKFSELGADSLDTVEIVMALEERFKITMEEEGAEKISTVQDAADLVEDMISSMPKVSS